MNTKATMRRQNTHSILGLSLLLSASGAYGCGADAYTAQICATAATFCPEKTVEAAGQLMAISEYTALYSLIGTQYGGNGHTTFGVPDLRGRAPIGYGQGPGLNPILMGMAVGTELTYLSDAQMPSHTHTAATTLGGVTFNGQMQGSTAGPDTGSPEGATPANTGSRQQIYTASAPSVAMHAGSVTGTITGDAATVVEPNGGSLPHNNRSPGLGLRFCMVADGLYPPRP